MSSLGSSRYLRKKRKKQTEARSLEGKIKACGELVAATNLEDRQVDNHSGSETGFGEVIVAGGIYGQRITSENSVSTRRARLFRSPPVGTRSTADRKNMMPLSEPSRKSRFSRATPLTQSNRMVPAVHVVCAISENRARETCVASLDAGSPVSLLVTKQGNGQMYEETLAYLEILRPDEIVLNEGRRSSPLTRKILELYNQHEDVEVHPFLTRRTTGSHDCSNFHPSDSFEGEEDAYGPCSTSTVVKFLSRGCFDQTKGSELLRRVAREETYCAALVEEYILLASAHAVLVYVQQSLGITYAPGCLFLSVNVGGSNRMEIDRSTLLQLELLVNSKTGKAKNSLIGTIDKTRTTVGSRLLRTNLIAPPVEADTINSRLDLVDKFLEHGDFFYEVEDHLRHLPDMDKMLSSIALIPQNRPRKLEANRSSDVRLASKGIAALVFIKSCLTAMPAFAEVLKKQLGAVGYEVDPADQATVKTSRNSISVGLGDRSIHSHGPMTSCQLLRAIAVVMSDPALLEVRSSISKAFTPSTEFSRNPHAMKHQECFALKADGGSLKMSRKSFLKNVDDIYRKADEYAELHGLTVGVKYTTSRGYFLAIPSEQIADNPIDIFIQATTAGKYVYCTTEEISSLNTRARANVDDLLVSTFDRIQELLNVARDHYDSLAGLCEAVALLDLCHSFADTVSTETLPWCRPLIGKAGIEEEVDLLHDHGQSSNSRRCLMIQQGRFAIALTSRKNSEPNSFIPNDTFASDDKSFTMISGINGSGKSTYLKQLAIIVTLAQCGSYVPAEQCSTPLFDRLCARMGNADDQENNISSFLIEMKEIAFVCKSATNRSLILIDELGRATSNEDGVAIAWAVGEFLLKKRAITFCATHYPLLTRMADIYPSVQNIHLDAMIVKDRNGDKITYSHQAKAGACQIDSDYGVKLSSLCGWPISAVHEANQIEPQVDSVLIKDCPIARESSHPSCRLRSFELLVSVGKTLETIKRDEQPRSLDSFLILLEEAKKQTLPACDETVLEHFGQLMYPNEAARSDDQHQIEVCGKSDQASVAKESSNETSSISSSDSDSSQDVEEKL